MSEQLRILDHGYVELIESWGSDERVVEAARMSTSKGFRGWGGDPCPQCREAGRLDERDGLWKDVESLHAGKACGTCKGTGKRRGDEQLLRYLWEHKHATPFEMAGMIVEVQAPIFVFREWHRHRTQSYNELSARYTELPDLCYVPDVARLMSSRQGNHNKQGSAPGFSESQAQAFQLKLRESFSSARADYERLLRSGVAREVARLVVPVAQYSRMRASANLRNWLAFLTLRLASNAQFEIRQYAQSVSGLIREHFPRTHALFAEG